MKKFVTVFVSTAAVFLALSFLSLTVFAQEGSETQNQQLQPEQVFEEDQRLEEFVDPKELNGALRQLADMKRDAQRLLKKAQKAANFANEVSELNGLLSDADKFSIAIRNASDGMDQRDALQEFYDAQLWETLNDVRTKIEFPTELKFIERDLKRLEKLLASKKFSIEKIDLSIVRASVEEIRSAITEARSQFNQGNFDDAREALVVIHEGLHPGEVVGVLYQLRDVNQQLKRLKQAVREEIHEVLAPVYEAVNSGDFREANMLLGDIRNDLWRVFEKAKGKSHANQDVQERLRKLEERLQNKQQQIEEQKFEPSQSKGYSPYQSYQASVLDILRNLLGL